MNGCELLYERMQLIASADLMARYFNNGPFLTAMHSMYTYERNLPQRSGRRHTTLSRQQSQRRSRGSTMSTYIHFRPLASSESTLDTAGSALCDSGLSSDGAATATVVLCGLSSTTGTIVPTVDAAKLCKLNMVGGLESGLRVVTMLVRLSRNTRQQRSIQNRQIIQISSCTKERLETRFKSIHKAQPSTAPRCLFRGLLHRPINKQRRDIIQVVRAGSHIPLWPQELRGDSGTCYGIAALVQYRARVLMNELYRSMTPKNVRECGPCLSRFALGIKLATSC